MTDPLNLPKILYDVTGTFEFELLIELMLRNWEHPFASNEEFRNNILESVAEMLKRASAGEDFGEMKAGEVNLVFCVWQSESLNVSEDGLVEKKDQREQWLKKIRRSLPSCFCAQDSLE